jgi:polar amino acid transport system substrate-binding protein
MREHLNGLISRKKGSWWSTPGTPWHFVYKRLAAAWTDRNAILYSAGLMTAERYPKLEAKSLIALIACGWLLAAAMPLPAAGAGAKSPTVEGVTVPSFWDPRRRPDRPDLSRLTVIRFLTEIDYPPFNYAGPDGNPAGFNVDLARMICEEIRVACTIQMRRFDTLLDAVSDNRGDAVIASIAATPETRQRVDFSDPYYRTPARFVARREADIEDVQPEKLEGRTVAVVAGTAHEAYLKVLFTEVELKPYPTVQAARDALRKGEVDLLFGDGISLAFWLNGTDSDNCCVFRGGPFLESRYFGEGVGIAVRRGNDLLHQALNWALFQLWEKGRFTDLWLRYFPISPF